jgi:hypothetical protein
MKHMNQPMLSLALAAVLGAGAAHAADDAATPRKPRAMVKKGVAYIKANGKDKGYAAITAATTRNSTTATCTSRCTSWTAPASPTAPTRRWSARTSSR